MELNFKAKQEIKAFFKEGKPVVILKLKMPYLECENEKLAMRFNAFYERLSLFYISSAEAFAKRTEKPLRPISINVEFLEKSIPVQFILVERTHKIRYPSGKILQGGACDIFDSELGLLVKERQYKKALKKREKAAGL